MTKQKPRGPEDTVICYYRLPVVLKNRIEAHAASQDRSASQLLKIILREYYGLTNGKQLAAPAVRRKASR